MTLTNEQIELCKNARGAIVMTHPGGIPDNHSTAFNTRLMYEVLSELLHLRRENERLRENDISQYEYFTGLRWRVISPYTLQMRRRAALSDTDKP